jgi:hypothetical protein
MVTWLGNPPGTGDRFTVDGDEVTLPVEVRSARMVAVQYLVDAGAAQRLIDYSGLEVVRLPGGRAALTLSAVAYADNDLGPYHEVAVAVAVRPHDAGPRWRPHPTRPTTFIHRLPVNQEFTCRVGRGLWGFPKWVADISYRERRGRTECVMQEGGSLVLGLEVRRGLVPLPASETSMTCYSSCDGVLRRTPWITRNRLAAARPAGATLVLGHEHPMAEELRTLGLPRRAVASITTGAMSARFGAPEVV